MIRETPTQTWTWRSLLHLRPLALRFIRCRVQNGKSAFLWFDSWSPLGPLISLINPSREQLLRIPLSAKVQDAYIDNRWMITQDVSRAFPALHQFLSSLVLPLPPFPDDYHVWSLNGTCTNSFPSAATWDSLRQRRPPQAWMKTIWFKGSIPKLAFNMWVVHLDRLPTRQRLVSWGITTNASCVLCSATEETRDHLFVQCSFSRSVWQLGFIRLGQTRQPLEDWLDLLRWTNKSSPQAPSLLRKLMAHVLTYHIWRQRNAIIHNNRPQSLMCIFRDIDSTIKNTISSRRNKRRWRNLMQQWLT